MSTQKQLKLRTQPKFRKRALAMLIDYVPIVIFTFWYAHRFGEPNSDGGYSVSGWPALVPPLVWFIFLILPEASTGQTFGKRALGLKVVSAPYGGKITLMQSIKRRILDFLDLFMFGIVAYISVKNSDLHQRLGDQWAQTVVVGGEESTCNNCEKMCILSPDEVINQQFDCPYCASRSPMQ